MKTASLLQQNWTQHGHFNAGKDQNKPTSRSDKTVERNTQRCLQKKMTILSAINLLSYC